MPHPTIVLAALAATLLTFPLAAAGTADAPELTDAAGDCAFVHGNEYADVVAAWISDETAADFVVNIALAKWTLDPLGAGMGVTIQFEHQGVQFGVAAVYAPAPIDDGWEFSNGYVNLEDGSASDFEEAEGSFTPGTPAIITVKFDKSHFPHGDSADNALRAFQGGSVDFKAVMPWGIAGQSPPVPPPFFFCDAVSSDAVYTFQTGGHSLHDMGGGADANATADANGTASTDDANASDDVAPLSENGGGNETPGAGLLLAAVAASGAALLRRRRA